MQQTVSEETKHLRATWKRCRPTVNGTPESLCSAHAVASGSTYQVNFFNAEDSVPLIDNDCWIPELSPEGFIGIYHHWNHAKSMNESKGPSLYVICQSYLPAACLEFADMVRDLGDKCSASDVYHSEEAHWLRQACSRNRGRLISKVCQQMQLKFPAMLDYNACKTDKPEILAFTVFETLHHDIQIVPNKSMCLSDEKEIIRLFNFCTASPNTACVMSPWDGVWVFHGQQQSHLFFPSITPKIAEQDCFMLKQQANFMFSTNIPETCEVLDIYSKKEIKSRKKRKALTNVIKKNHTHALDILSSIDMQSTTDLEVMKDLMMSYSNDQQDVDIIMKAYNRSITKMASLVVENSRQGTAPTKKKTFLYFDEHVLYAMEKQGWRRSDGFTAFIPLACGLCELWKRPDML